MHSPALHVQRAIKAFASLKMTPREAEVLFWISQGKSNHDIGIILGAKTRTVCKHVEHIFRKLSVENRTTAAMVALETYRSAELVSANKPVGRWAAVTGLITTQLCAMWSDSTKFYEELVRLVA